MPYLGCALHFLLEPQLSMKTRVEAWRDLESRTFDVCVIGGGATGAGCALDAQLREYETVLLEAGDFGGATSSASTKLAHGGVRYLERAVRKFDRTQYGVVREALRERRRMLNNAPHLAHGREFLIPCFSRAQVLYYGLGTKLYEWMAGPDSLGRSRTLTRSGMFARLRDLRSTALQGGVLFKDGQFDDARYCLSLIKTFCNADGTAINYARVARFEKTADGKIASAIVEDAFSGKKAAVRARIFVNATGPFSDSMRTMANVESQPKLVLSKGAHILLPLKHEGPALVIPKTEDGRVIFAIPWMDRLLVGTTEEPVSSDEEISVTRQDAEYLLSHLNRYVACEYSIGDIVSAFAGIRPLLRSQDSGSTKDLIREHEVAVDDGSGLISILGGKWTSYRAMAEDTIDVVQDRLGARAPCGTQDYGLAGGEGYHRELWKAIAGDLPEATARHLVSKFGSEASAVLSLGRERPEWKTPVVAGWPAIQAEVVYCIREEMAASVEDVLARRLGLQLYDWELAMKAAPIVAELLGSEFGWSTDQVWRGSQAYIDKVVRQKRILQRADSQNA